MIIFYAQIVRPKLTTIHQDVHQKALLALRKLLLAAEEGTCRKNVKSPVWLVKRFCKRVAGSLFYVMMTFPGASSEIRLEIIFRGQ